LEKVQIQDGLQHRGLRVLVVEDELLIAMLLEDMIIELGAEFIGPCLGLAEALEAARQDNFDVALIDMNLGGERADDVAKLLASRGIPFALASGGHDAGHSLGQAAELYKPFSFDDVVATLNQLGAARA
jgi:CheY-like chemotaxis protein